MKAVGTMFLLKLLSCAAAMLLPLYLPAEIVLQEPASGATVQLLPENQKMLLALPSHAGRVARLAADRAKGSDFGYHAGTLKWRTSLPVRFRWKCTAGEKGPFILRISRDAGFREVKEIVSRTESIEVPPFLLNLRLGRKYYWNVSSDRGKKKSASGSFTTDPQPPRWIMLEGPCRNIRDLGGYVAADGRKVRQGMLFRGERLNENSFDPAHPGRSRLMVADAEYLRDELKIRTDLDLRSPGETAGLKVSPSGARSSSSISTAHLTSGFSAITAAARWQRYSRYCATRRIIRFISIAAAARTGPVRWRSCSTVCSACPKTTSAPIGETRSSRGCRTICRKNTGTNSISLRLSRVSKNTENPAIRCGNRSKVICWLTG